MSLNHTGTGDLFVFTVTGKAVIVSERHADKFLFYAMDL